MSYLTDLPENRLRKIIDNCLDNKGKKIDIDIILKSKIFSKEEYDDLKVFYNNAQSIKKIENEEHKITKKPSQIQSELNICEKRLKEIEFTMYPTEEEEIEYTKLLNEQSKLSNQYLRLIRENEEKLKLGDR